MTTLDEALAAHPATPDTVRSTASVGYICGVPREVMRVIKVEAVPERWCFGERKRRTGTWTLSAPDTDWVLETHAYGWADPVWAYRCDGCGEDRALFPGRYWEWSE